MWGRDMECTEIYGHVDMYWGETTAYIKFWGNVCIYEGVYRYGCGGLHEYGYVSMLVERVRNHHMHDGE